MVCLPCFIIPLLLYIWHKFVQPIMLRYWNPWEKKDEKGNVIKAGPDFPFQCNGGVCPFVKMPLADGQPGEGGAAPEAKPSDGECNASPLAAVDENTVKKDK